MENKNIVANKLYNLHPDTDLPNEMNISLFPVGPPAEGLDFCNLKTQLRRHTFMPPILLKGVFLILVIFHLNNTSAQTNWQETRYGRANLDERNRSVCKVPSGSLFMAGFSADSGQTDVMNFSLSKFNSTEGITELWNSGSSDPDYAYSIATDGTYLYLAGETQAFPETNAYLIKSDTLGNILWKKSYGAGNQLGEMFKWVEYDGMGSLWICGYQSDTIGGLGNDFWLVKTDTSGQVLLSRSFGTRDNDYAQMLLNSNDGGCWVLGDSKAVNGHYDVCLTRLNAAGEVMWSQFYGDTLDDGSQSMCLTPQGDLMIFGESVPVPNAPFDFLFILADSARGHALRMRLAGGSGADAAFGGAVLQDGSCLFTGYSNSQVAGPVKLIAGTLDIFGNLSSLQSFGGTGINIGYQLLQEDENTFCITGYYTDSLGDFCLLRTDIPVSGAPFLPGGEKFSFFPNPIQAGEILQSDKDLKNYTWILHDPSGRNVQKISGGEHAGLRMPESLTEGIYLLCGTDPSGKTYNSVIYVGKTLH